MSSQLRCSPGPRSPQGFLALRKHSDRLVLLVRMMSRSGFPCFKAGERAVKALEKRMQVGTVDVRLQHLLPHGLTSDWSGCRVCYGDNGEDGWQVKGAGH